MKSVQTLTISGALAGPAFTAPIGTLQRAGIYTAPTDFEILGYECVFSMQMDFSTVPPVFPTGALLYNVNITRISIPTSNVPNAPTQNSFFLSVMQALNTYLPAASYAGSPNQLLGSNTVSFMLPPGQPIKVATGQSLTTYLGLAGVTAFNSASMDTVLFVNM